MDRGAVVAVNVGRPRELDHNGRPTTSAIWKSPVPGRVMAQGVNLGGDDQADRSVHGGPDQALYAYALEDTTWWEQELGRALEPGCFGENVTTTDHDVNGALIGEEWLIGEARFAVTQPRVPCWKLGVRLEEPDMIRRFAHAGRPGAYLRIVQEGAIGAGDTVEVVHRPEHDVTIADLARIYHRDRHEAVRLLDVAELTDHWRSWAVEHTASDH